MFLPTVPMTSRIYAVMLASYVCHYITQKLWLFLVVQHPFWYTQVQRSTYQMLNMNNNDRYVYVCSANAAVYK